MDEAGVEQSGARITTAPELLRALRRRWWLLALCIVGLTGAAIAKTSAEEPYYTASASLLFKADNLSQSVIGVYSNDPFQDADRVGATNVELLGLASTQQRAAQVLGISREDVKSAVSASASGGSDVVLVTATGADPKRVAYVANTYARVFVTDQRTRRIEQILSAQQAVDRELKQFRGSFPASQAADLERQANQLRVLAKLQTGGVQLVSVADVPESPAGPSVRKSAVLAFLASVILGLGLVLLLERLDTRARTIDDFTVEFDRPLLGNLPPIRRRKEPLDDSSIQEGVQLLRVNLAYAGVGEAVRVLALTSAIPDEGKSTVSSSLASALAQAGSSVLLIEADLRRGTLAERLGATPEHGLADVLARGVAPADAIVSTNQWGSPNAPRTAKKGGRLSLLAAGFRVPNPDDLVESQAMIDLLAWARDEYDVVLVDTPPALAVPETLALLAIVDGTVVVGRVGTSRRQRIRALARQLNTVGQPPLGLVVFTAGRAEATYGFEYSAEYSGSSNLSARPLWAPVASAPSDAATSTASGRTKTESVSAT